MGFQVLRKTSPRMKCPPPAALVAQLSAPIRQRAKGRRNHSQVPGGDRPAPAESAANPRARRRLARPEFMQGRALWSPSLSGRSARVDRGPAEPQAAGQVHVRASHQPDRAVGQRGRAGHPAAHGRALSSRRRPTNENIPSSAIPPSRRPGRWGRSPPGRVWPRWPRLP